jgi:hypothetical protein
MAVLGTGFIEIYGADRAQSGAVLAAENLRR